MSPSVFSYTNLPQNGNFAAGDTWVSPSGNEIRFGYNYAYHLNSPSASTIATDGDIRMRNSPAAPIRSTTAVQDSR